MASERPPAQSGSFYPSDPQELSGRIGDLLSRTHTMLEPSVSPDLVRAVIVPHGPLDRSGPVAASAYGLLRERTLPPEKVVIAGPLHTFTEYGVVLPTSPAFRIPTGTHPVDRKTIQKLAFYSETLFSDEAHAFEHAIELQLPFLQELWGQVPIVPLGFSDVSSDVLSHIFQTLLGDPGTLLILTSDFSQQYSYAQARQIDGENFGRILAGMPVESLNACGALGINSLCKVARSTRLACRLLDDRNSGDIAGSKIQVSGYGAFVFMSGGPHP